MSDDLEKGLNEIIDADIAFKKAVIASLQELSPWFMEADKRPKVVAELSSSANAKLIKQGFNNLVIRLPSMLFLPRQGDEIEVELEGKTAFLTVVKRRIKFAENDVPTVTLFFDLPSSPQM